MAKNGVGGEGEVSHPLLHFENSFAHSQAVYRNFAVTHPLVNLLYSYYNQFPTISRIFAIWRDP